jgi:hypothetical protein
MIRNFQETVLDFYNFFIINCLIVNQSLTQQALEGCVSVEEWLPGRLRHASPSTVVSGESALPDRNNHIKFLKS